MLITNTYDLLCDMYNELKENILYHFNLYRNVETNRIDGLLSILLEHQKIIYCSEKEKVNHHPIYSIFHNKNIK